jgi:PTS system nitrogen regulatory IIA component
MDLGNILSLESVFMDFVSEGKDEALRELSSLAAGVLGMEMGPIYSAVRSRESLGSTALGNGLVMPHGKLEALESTRLFLARVGPGANLDFGGPDGLPARLIALLLSPPTPTPQYRKILALLGRRLNSPRNVSLLMSCPDQKTFHETFLFLSDSLD